MKHREYLGNCILFSPYVYKYNHQCLLYLETPQVNFSTADFVRVAKLISFLRQTLGVKDRFDVKVIETCIKTHANLKV